MRIISQQLLTLLFNSLWQIALIAAVATLCARLLRGSKAGARHLLWVAALLAPVCLAAVTFWLGARQDLFKLRPTASKITFSQTDLVNALPINFPVGGPLLPLPAPEKTIPVGQRVALALLAGYGLLFAYRSIQFLRAWRKTRAIVHGANKAELPAHINEIVERCTEMIGIKEVRVLWSPSVAVPVTIGAFRPVIILPETMLGERDAELLTAAFGHELAHVRRRDYALNFLYELLYVPISFHPAAAWVKRRVRQTREQRCDELVTEKLLNAAAYARSLVKMAGWAAPIIHSTPTISVGIVDAGNLEERVMSILRKPRISARKKGLSIAAASLLFAIPCIAAAPHILRVSINSPTERAAQPHVSAPPASYATSIAEISPARQEGARQNDAANKSQENRDYPRCVHCPMPTYAQDARDKKIEGEVWVEATVGTDGMAHDLKVTKSLYLSLDNNAIEAIKTWRFEPAMKDGKPIEKRTPIRVTFLLDPSTEDEAREKRELALQENEARGYAYKAMLDDRQRELEAGHDQDLEAAQKAREQLLVDQELKLQALEHQIEGLERTKERAAAANDAEGQRRAEEELAQIQNMLTNQMRETELAKQKQAEEKDKFVYLGDDRGEPHKYVVYGPDGKKVLTAIPAIQAELAKQVKIPMARAIDAATKDHPGTVVNCELRGGGNEQVVYAITIVSGNERDGRPVIVLVNAIDGKIVDAKGR